MRKGKILLDLTTLRRFVKQNTVFVKLGRFPSFISSARTSVFYLKLFLFCLLLMIAFPFSAKAGASLYLSPASNSYSVGNTFYVTLFVNSGGRNINAAEADLTFDKTKITVHSISTSQSIFSLWPRPPSYSNTNGTIYFTGGLPSPGFNGTAGNIFVIRFNAIAEGTAYVSFMEGAKVLLDDGLGTNILEQTFGAEYEILPAPPIVSCSAVPNPALLNETVTFTAFASGGDGSYDYLWSGDCAGTLSSCSNSYSAAGTKTATVKVTSRGQSSYANCSVVINEPPLTVLCSASADSVYVNEQVTFTAQASGGIGSYTYVWSNACAGTLSSCSNSYSAAGIKIATVTVTSGSQVSSSDCLLDVNIICPPLVCPLPKCSLCVCFAPPPLISQECPHCPGTGECPDCPVFIYYPCPEPVQCTAPEVLLSQPLTFTDYCDKCTEYANCRQKLKEVKIWIVVSFVLILLTALFLLIFRTIF